MKNAHNKSPVSEEISRPETEEPLVPTDSQLLNALLDDFPSYIYFKDINSRFIRNSKSHAKALGVKDPSEAIGKSDFDFFSKEHAEQAYQDEQQIIKTGESLVAKEEKETWPDRPDTWASTTKMPLRDAKGRIIGTFGISKDITEEKHLRENIEDLQKDVGRTFHTLSATLLQVTHTIMPAINALDPDPFEGKLLPSTDEIWKELAGLRNALASMVRKLLESIQTPLQKEALPPEDWVELDKLLSLIKEVEKIYIPEQRAPTLRRAARRVIDILSNIKKGRLPQELVREVRRSAEQLERMTCLIALHQVEDRILETDYMVRDLRERVLTGVKKTEKPESYEFWDLVKEAIEGLSEYASHKGIDFRRDNRSENVYVWVGRHDIIRVVNNLLHNAIKYSWWRAPNVIPWIEIRSYIKAGQVYLEIEDYGVPIPKDEIEEDLIFQLGWRGRLSGQRGRIGTGIGLADARDTARRYRGEVGITSRPASQYASIDDLSVPHIKTATLSLPICKRKGE
jgi:PAS domain S-box-containing protein